MLQPTLKMFKWEPKVLEEPEIQGGSNASAPTDPFQEGLVESTSDDNVKLVVGSGGRGKGVDPKVPLLTRKAHHRSRNKKIHVQIKPVIARLNSLGEILCSLQSDISSIFISHSTGAKEIGAVKNELHEIRSELGSLKKLVTDLLDFVRVQLSAPTPPAPTQSVLEAISCRIWATKASLEEYGPCAVEDISVGPSGPSVQMGSVAGPTGPQVSVEEVVVPPGPFESPNLQTPPPSSPPTSFTTPPAPETIKKPLPKHISSPTPFPTATSSSPPSSSSIPHPTFEAPPASSSSAGPSSKVPSSAAPSNQLPPTSAFGSFHLPTPPSFIIIIPKAASVIPHSMHGIKDEFEEAILRIMPEIAVLPKLHFLFMESEVGPIIFERFARVMAWTFVQRGTPLAFNRFIFREYQRGFIKSSVLAPILLESERFDNSEWCKAYPKTALQLEELNSSLHKSNQFILSPKNFMDLNSINLVSDRYSIWIDRYKIFIVLKKDLLDHKLHHPLSIDKFLQHASFGTAGPYKSSLSNQEYTSFNEDQRLLHIKRLGPEMGPSYNII
ncbi:hypothetical protein Taro_049001 [Colocasia esculenta]|uniref:Uncharacterized protein n=1 Tax=Colocasia esculenta TaxID=4460 RepID=A0A843X9T1_COLES|nr:hypothetical protein [Colocasia esculenta]